jgi:polysaccharide export outer membrane protein
VSAAMTRLARLAVLAVLVCAAPASAQVDLDVPATTAPPMTRPSEGTPNVTGVRGTPERLPVTAMSGAIDPRRYYVGPGDLLVVQVWGQISRTIPLEVGPEGTVLLQGAGSLKVSDRTLADVQADLEQRIRRQLRGVEIDVRLLRPRTFLVYLTGQVKSPGPSPALGGSRVADILTPAVLADGASRRRIQVRHRDGSTEDVDLELFLRNGNDAINPWLRDGDVIQVPTATEFIHALGAVAQPGRYELGPRDSLRTLLQLAGDPLPSAEAGRALYLRFDRDPFKPESAWVALGDIYRGFANFPLTDGARLYVQYIPQYRQQYEATILGEVARPGSYPIVEGRTRLSELVNAAEGFLPTADLSSLRVHRANPVAHERDPELDRLLRLSRNELTASEYEVLRTKLAARSEDYRVDWNRLQSQKELDLLLRSDDVVRVERLVPSIRVDGEVRRPGIINYVAGQRLSDYIRQSGGFTDRAWQGKVRVTRAVSGQTLLARNVTTLDPGDFVWVPEKPDVTVWQQARDVLTALASVATIIIAIRSVN